MELGKYWKIYKLFTQIEKEGRMGKNIFKSKTIWFNALSIAAILVDHFAQTKILPPDISAAALAVINVFLRFSTTQPVTVKK